ncbi:MAG: DUF222 domain-containing protein [Streptosporangiales bacterium]|nr:DUF222 domain-containing protein [Streptosporangiales bacterium]
MFEPRVDADPAGAVEASARMLAGVPARRSVPPAELVTRAPSPSVVSALVEACGGDLDHDGLLDAVAVAQRCVGWLLGLQHDLVARLLESPLPGTPGDSPEYTQEELQCELLTTPHQAGTLVTVAGDLATRLTGTRELLAAGRLSIERVRFLSRHTVHLDDSQCAAVEVLILPDAPEQTEPEFRRAVRKAVLEVDPADAERRHARAVDARTVTRIPLPDGMVGLWLELPAESAQLVWSAAEKWSRPDGLYDRRTADQRRADALVAICTAALSGHLRIRTGLPVADVQVTVSLDTLLGDMEAPGDLAGYGPVTPSVARAIAERAGARFTRLVVHPDTGAMLCVDPVTYGSRDELVTHAHDPPPPIEHSRACAGARSVDGRHPDPYRPTVRQQRAVRARDPVCTFPGCSRPAARCEIDHVTPYGDGGPTCLCNLRPGCKRHHQAKTAKVWRLEHDLDGSCTWIGPTGRGYRSAPYDHRPG